MLEPLVAGLNWIKTRAWAGIRTVFSSGKYAASAVLLGLLFTGLYLFSIQHIVYFSSVDLSLQTAIPSIELVNGWAEKIFKTRVTFIWEPIAAVYLTPRLMIKLAVPNLLLGGFLGGLVGINLSMGFYELFRGQSSNSVDSVRSFFAAIPSLLTGFACCAPTILIAVGGSLAAGLSAGLVAARPYFIPISFAILIFNAGWTGANVSNEGVCRQAIAEVDPEEA